MKNLTYYWSSWGWLEKLIVFEIGFFLVGSFLSLIGVPFNLFFELSSELSSWLIMPWSLLTYSLVHADLWHLVFNMLWLYMASQLFLSLFDSARLFTVYLLGVFFAGISFILTYAISGTQGVLVGSSAGVMAVLIFMATYTPNQPIRVLFFTIKLWHLGALFVLIDLLQLSGGSNFGGRIAHLVGAAIGYFMASQLLKGVEIAEFMQTSIRGFMQGGFPAFFKTGRKPSSSSRRKSQSNSNRSEQEQIDRILDKISASGYDSLSADEKAFLFKKGQR